jgi:hypothetical protein
MNDGTAGAQGTFTEPTSGPGTGAMHTLNGIMAKAPAADNANGAVPAEVLTGKTYWSLRTTGGTWGQQTGTMPNRGAVTIVPTTTAQTIPMGYHNGSGQVEGDADLTAGNIKDGVDIFGVVGTFTGGGGYDAVPKTGQISSEATGDDGDLEMGVAWPSRRFTDNSDGTVTDNLTGLIWLKNANCAGGTAHWATALSYSNALYDGCTNCFGIGGDCGLSDGSSAGDWRLPNVVATTMSQSTAAPLPVGANVYALVDSVDYSTTYGAVWESNEDNNLFGPVTSTTRVAGEAAPVVDQDQPASREGLPPR